MNIFYTRHDPRFYDKRLYFGGSSKSNTSSSSSQQYADNRSVVNTSTDSHDYTDGSTNNTSYAVDNSLRYADSGNVDNSSRVSNSGNTSWLQALTNSGNTSNSASYSDSRSWMQSLSDSGNTADSHDTDYSVINSGASSDNHAVTVTNTGTDAARIVELQSQLMQAMGEQNSDSLRTLAAFGMRANDNAADLIGQTSANAMRSSSHMLDVAGDLMTKAAGATNAGIGAAMAASDQTKQSAAMSQKTMLIAGALVVVVLLLKK